LGGDASFDFGGSDQSVGSALEPSPPLAPAPASKPAPGLTLGGDDSFGFGGSDQSAGPALEPSPLLAPAPASEPGPGLILGGDDAGYGFVGPAPAESRASGQPEGGALAMTDESSALGGSRHGEPQPSMSFGLEKPPSPSTPPSLSPPAADAPLPAPAASRAKPEAESPAKTANPKPGGTGAIEKPRPETGGTTVLIRYTCPKCKTQGMQAVDKVGAVVNCSNCGKAMRLVMKR
jgi:hypothetical protein